MSWQILVFYPITYTVFVAFSRLINLFKYELFFVFIKYANILFIINIK